MTFIKNSSPKILLCLAAAIPFWTLGLALPVIGEPVFGILYGMALALLKCPEILTQCIRFASKKMLQWSDILLGFEMDLVNYPLSKANGLPASSTS